jgi:chromosome segregation ATPase
MNFAGSIRHHAICQDRVLKENSMFEENALFEIAEVLNVDGIDSPAAAARGDAQGASTDPRHQPASASPQGLDSQASIFFGLIQDYKLLADRACEAAVREARHAAQIEEMAAAEITSLRLQLKEKIEALESRDRTLREREVIAKETIDGLEAALRDKEEQIATCQSRARALLGEIEGLNKRLSDIASGMNQAEARFRDFAGQQQGTINFLYQELKTKENLLQANEEVMRQLEDQARFALTSLEEKLQTMDATLQIKEAELREKQSALEMNAANDKILERFMQELTVQSQALMAELSEKKEVVAKLENNMHRSFESGFAIEQNGTVQERLL